MIPAQDFRMNFHRRIFLHAADRGRFGKQVTATGLRSILGLPS
jgi:hypothetical protein